MKKSYFSILFSAVAFFAANVIHAQQPYYGGGITGDVSVTIEGQSEPETGTVDAQWSITQTETGGISILASGTIAGKGFKADFNWSSDGQGQSQGNWTVPGFSGYGGDFALDPLTLTCSFSGTIPGGYGQTALKISGTGTLEVQGKPIAQMGGPLSGNLGGKIAATFMGMPVTGDFSGLASGNWYINVFGSNDISGTMNASFAGTAITEPTAGFGPASSFSVPISGTLEGTFKIDKSGNLSFNGQTKYQLQSQGLDISAMTGFDFTIPFDMSQGIKMTGSIPFTGSQTVSIPFVGSSPVTYTIDATFDITLNEGDPAAIVPIQMEKKTESFWYITGTLPDQSTCGPSNGMTPTTLNFSGAPIGITAHGAILTGSQSNPADTSKVYGHAKISEPGFFSIPVSDAVGSVTLFVFSDTDFSGGGSPGDIGGHYCEPGSFEPGVLYSPGSGNTVTVSGFSLGVLPVQISGNVLIDGTTLAGIDTVTKIVTQVYDSGNSLLDFSYSSVNTLNFGVWVNNVTPGDTVKINVFIDTNDNGIEDPSEPKGSLTHQVGSDVTDNTGLMVLID